MNIDQSTTYVNPAPCTSAKLAGSRQVLLVVLLIFLGTIVITACLPNQKTILQGNGSSTCSADVHLITHTVVCVRKWGDNWVSCSMNGSIENNGTIRASGVMVVLEFGQTLNGVRSSTYNLLSDLDPGDKKEFENGFFYYEPLTEYDIRVECNNVPAEQPTYVQENSSATPSITQDDHLSSENLFLSLGPNDDVRTLVIDPKDSSTLYAGTSTQGVLKSIDGGATWNESSKGLGDGRVDVLVINPLQPATLYAATYDADWGEHGVFKSIDGGATWIETLDDGMTGAFVRSLVIDPLTPSTVYAMTGNSVFKSTNGGEEWKILNVGSSESLIGFLTINPLIPTNLYAVESETSGLKLILSTDGGESWNQVGAGLPDNGIISIALDPHNTPATLYLSTAMGMFKSTNAGESWQDINSGMKESTTIFALAVDPVNPSTIYAVGTKYGGDIFISTNGGDNWYPLGTNLSDMWVRALVWDPENPRRLYAATERGVFVLDR